MAKGPCPEDPNNPSGPEAPNFQSTKAGSPGMGELKGRQLWHLDRIDSRVNGDFKYGWHLDGRGVHVYVVDSGVRTTHEQFEGRAIPTLETQSGHRVVCNPKNTSCASDVHGHGSHCAGTVGGKR